MNPPTSAEKTSPSTARLWLQRIRDVQLSRLTPQDRQRLQQRAEDAKRMRSLTLQTSAVRLQSMSLTLEARRALTITDHAAGAMDQAAQRTVELTGAWENPVELQRIMAREQEQEARSRQELIAADATAASGGSDDIAALLSQLREEPSDDATRESKFSTYEKYASSVGEVRKSLETTVSNAESSFPTGGPREALAKEMKKIDSPERNGIHFESRNWFVHEMAKQSASNIQFMNSVSHLVESRLNLLIQSTQTDCPVCLEAYNSDTVVPELLPCCHTVCAPCWAQWKAVRGAAVFCPMCKNSDFLQVLSDGA